MMHRKWQLLHSQHFIHAHTLFFQPNKRPLKYPESAKITDTVERGPWRALKTQRRKKKPEREIQKKKEHVFATLPSAFVCVSCKTIKRLPYFFFFV